MRDLNQVTTYRLMFVPEQGIDQPPSLISEGAATKDEQRTMLKDEHDKLWAEESDPNDPHYGHFIRHNLGVIDSVLQDDVAAVAVSVPYGCLVMC